MTRNSALIILRRVVSWSDGVGLLPTRGAIRETVDTLEAETGQLPFFLGPPATVGDPLADWTDYRSVNP